MDGLYKDERVKLAYSDFFIGVYGLTPLEIFNSDFQEEKKRGMKWYREHADMMVELLQLGGKAYRAEIRIHALQCEQVRKNNSHFSLLDEEAILLFYKKNL
jgi:hypothetical protein